MSREPTGPRRSTRAGAHDIVVLVVAATLLIAYEGGPTPWETALPYTVALILLAFMDVHLPHGDTVDVDAAVVIASTYIFGPITALGMVFVSRGVAHLVQYRLRPRSEIVPSIAKRAVGIAASTAALVPLSALALGRAEIYLNGFVAGIAYVLVSLVYSQIGLALERQDSVIRMTAGNLALQGPVLAAEVCVAILTVLIHDEMGIWGLALVLFLAVMTRQSFALLLDVRHGYQATVEALVGAMEAQGIHETGIGSRAAIVARAAGAEYGWFGKSLENMGYAALLIHFGLSFVTRDETTGEARPTPLAEVEFLRPVAPIVEVAETPRLSAPVTRRTLVKAYIVSLCVARLTPGRAEKKVAGLSGQLTPRERWRAEDAVERALRKSGIA